MRVSRPTSCAASWVGRTSSPAVSTRSSSATGCAAGGSAWSPSATCRVTSTARSRTPWSRPGAGWSGSGSCVNIDRIAAEELIATGVRAVLNAAQSSDGRYPNAGPLLLVRAGVTLIDIEGADPCELLEDGAEGTLAAGVLSGAGGEILRGRVLDVAELETVS